MNVYVSEVREREKKKPCNAICCWLCIASNRNDIERVSEREIKCVYGESRIFLTISLFLTLTYIWDGMSLGPPSFSHSLAEHDCAVQRQKITLYSRNSSIIAAFDQTHMPSCIYVICDLGLDFKDRSINIGDFHILILRFFSIPFVTC